VLRQDSVVNNGKAVVNFVQHVRSLHAIIRIVVVAGVVQAQPVPEAASPRYSPVTQISVLLYFASDNKFTGNRINGIR